MYPITLYYSWWKLYSFVIVLSGYCLFKDKLKSGGWLEKAPVSKNGPWPAIPLVYICKSGIYTVLERGHVLETRVKACALISFETSEMMHAYWKSWTHGHHSSLLHSFYPLFYLLLYVLFVYGLLAFFC